MARSGLTKSQVRTIRDRLLADGRYPSVDAVRHALGDTGSKSTIHKYLKELGEDEAGVVAPPRDDTARTLHGIVEQLADRLHADAEERLRAMAARHERALRDKDAELARLRATVAALHARIGQLEEEALFALPPDASWDAGRAADGFGSFDSLALSSRCMGRDISPFGMVRGTSRAEVFACDSGWPGARKAA
jgi:hypothetical protein